MDSPDIASWPPLAPDTLGGVKGLDSPTSGQLLRSVSRRPFPEIHPAAACWGPSQPHRVTQIKQSVHGLSWRQASTLNRFYSVQGSASSQGSQDLCPPVDLGKAIFLFPGKQKTQGFWHPTLVELDCHGRGRCEPSLSGADAESRFSSLVRQIV